MSNRVTIKVGDPDCRRGWSLYLVVDLAYLYSQNDNAMKKGT